MTFLSGHPEEDVSPTKDLCFFSCPELLEGAGLPPAFGSIGPLRKNSVRHLLRQHTFMLASLVSFALVLVSLFAYLVKEPQREADVVLAQIRQVEIGKTSLEDVRQMLAKGGLHQGAKIICDQSYCSYSALEENRLLRWLHLAPSSYLQTGIAFSNGSASRIYISANIGSYGDTALVRFIQQEDLDNSPVSFFQCNSADGICVKRYNQTDGSPMRVYISVSPSAPAQERNRLLSFNTACFSKVFGCKDARELLPIRENQ